MTRLAVGALMAACLAACSSPQRRIKKNQAAFDSYPPAIQQAISEGRAEVGMNAEQVLMALGKPDREYSRKTVSVAQEVWGYGRGGSGRPGLGVGMGVIGGGPTVYSGGISIGAGDDHYHYNELTRVVFEQGKVGTVENREK